MLRAFYLKQKGYFIMHIFINLGFSYNNMLWTSFHAINSFFHDIKTSFWGL